jgi:3-(3-hydroxy-phenyl)propionate hydroxylase
MPVAGHDPVVIVGRGPAGMVTALQLAAMGVRSAVIDRQAIDHVEHGSKAVLIAGHVAEITLPLGAGQSILDEGLAWTTGRVFVRGKEVDTRHVASPPGLVPRVLNLTQQRVEELLLAQVRREPLITLIPDATVTGVSLDTDQRGATVSYTVGGEENVIWARWLIGCDGARSTVRHALGIPFTGYGHDDTFLIADIVADLPFPAERHLHFDHVANPRRTILIHPQPGSTWHIDWQVGQEVDAQEELASGGLDRRLRYLTGDIPYEVRWVTAYKFKQLRARRFRRGCVFLAGDAAHLTSPYGARGMNSGIADAQNIGWRLGMVARGWAEETLLEGYSTEREFAAEENLSITGRTARFMCPRSRRERMRQRMVLAAARHFPALGRYVDSGRFYEPPAYPAPGAPTAGTLRAGQLVPDGVLTDAASGTRRLRELLTGGISVVWFPGVSQADPGHAAKALTADLPAGFPCSLFYVSPGIPAGTPGRAYVHIPDPGNAISQAWNQGVAPATGRMFLIRPDAYIAAVIDSSCITPESDLSTHVRAAFHMPCD